MEIPDQRKVWEKEYRMRGTLWRGKDLEPIDSFVIPPALYNGCGNGKGLGKSEGIIGLDFSKNALKLFRKTNRIVVCGDMTALPFKDSSFNTVLFIHSLEHLKENDRRKAISEGSRVLKPEGIVIVKVFSTQDFRYGKGKLVEANTFQRGNGIITHYFDMDELYWNGFEITYKKDIRYFLIINGVKRIRSEILIKYKKL